MKSSFQLACLVLLMTLHGAVASRATLVSETLGNGVGYSGTGAMGCWKASYQLDPEYICPATGAMPGYRSALLPHGDSGDCSLQDACTGEVFPVSRFEVTRSSPYMVKDVDYDEGLASYRDSIFDTDASKKLFAEAWCNGDAQTSGAVRTEIVIRKSGGRRWATIVVQEMSSQGDRPGQAVYTLKKVMPVEVYRSDAGAVVRFSRDEMALSIHLDQPLAWNSFEKKADFQADIDGRALVSSEMSCRLAE